jgi:hypothetical protein
MSHPHHTWQRCGDAGYLEREEAVDPEADNPDSAMEWQGWLEPKGCAAVPVAERRKMVCGLPKIYPWNP